jgi:hypothetical protein
MQPNGYGKYEIPMEKLLPHGAWLVSGVEAIKDYKLSKPGPDGFVQALDKNTRKPLWAAIVQSGDMENAPPWLQRFKVKIPSDMRPEVPPAMPGTPFRPVWLHGLTVTPYVDDSKCTAPEPGREHRCGARMAYSIRATGISAPKPASRPTQASRSGGAE